MDWPQECGCHVQAAEVQGRLGRFQAAMDSLVGGGEHERAALVCEQAAHAILQAAASEPGAELETATGMTAAARKASGYRMKAAEQYYLAGACVSVWRGGARS